jgi:hypothetical protein
VVTTVGVGVPVDEVPVLDVVDVTDEIVVEVVGTGWDDELVLLPAGLVLLPTGVVSIEVLVAVVVMVESSVVDEATVDSTGIEADVVLFEVVGAESSGVLFVEAESEGKELEDVVLVVFAVTDILRLLDGEGVSDTLEPVETLE